MRIDFHLMGSLFRFANYAELGTQISGRFEKTIKNVAKKYQSGVDVRAALKLLSLAIQCHIDALIEDRKQVDKFVNMMDDIAEGKIDPRNGEPN